MQYRPPTIKERGLEFYLNSTRHNHNGLGWSDFKQRMDLDVPKSRIARDFGISRNGIQKWVGIYREMSNDSNQAN